MQKNTALLVIFSLRYLLLNRGVEAGNGTPGCMQTMVLEVLAQSHHKHLWAQGWTVSVPP